MNEILTNLLAKLGGLLGSILTAADAVAYYISTAISYIVSKPIVLAASVFAVLLMGKSINVGRVFSVKSK